MSILVTDAVFKSLVKLQRTFTHHVVVKANLLIGRTSFGYVAFTGDGGDDGEGVFCVDLSGVANLKPDAGTRVLITKTSVDLTSEGVPRSEPVVLLSDSDLELPKPLSESRWTLPEDFCETYKKLIPFCGFDNIDTKRYSQNCVGIGPGCLCATDGVAFIQIPFCLQGLFDEFKQHYVDCEYKKQQQATGPAPDYEKLKETLLENGVFRHDKTRLLLPQGIPFQKKETVWAITERKGSIYLRIAQSGMILYVAVPDGCLPLLSTVRDKNYTPLMTLAVHETKWFASVVDKDCKRVILLSLAGMAGICRQKSWGFGSEEIVYKTNIPVEVQEDELIGEIAVEQFRKAMKLGKAYHVYRTAGILDLRAEDGTHVWLVLNEPPQNLELPDDIREIEVRRPGTGILFPVDYEKIAAENAAKLSCF